VVGRKLEVRSQRAADRADRIKVRDISGPSRPGIYGRPDKRAPNRSRYGCQHGGELRIAEWNEWVERSGSCRTARVAESDAGAERMNAK